MTTEEVTTERVSFSTTNKHGGKSEVLFDRKKKPGKRVYKDNKKNRDLGRVGKEIQMSNKLVDRALEVKNNNVPRDKMGRFYKRTLDI